jgi:hypothetical protein
VLQQHLLFICCSVTITGSSALELPLAIFGSDCVVLWHWSEPGLARQWWFSSMLCCCAQPLEMGLIQHAAWQGKGILEGTTVACSLCKPWRLPKMFNQIQGSALDCKRCSVWCVVYMRLWKRGLDNSWCGTVRTVEQVCCSRCSGSVV